jgi:hypothetical protein
MRASRGGTDGIGDRVFDGASPFGGGRDDLDVRPSAAPSTTPEPVDRARACGGRGGAFGMTTVRSERDRCDGGTTVRSERDRCDGGTTSIGGRPVRAVDGGGNASTVSSEAGSARGVSKGARPITLVDSSSPSDPSSGSGRGRLTFAGGRGVVGGRTAIGRRIGGFAPATGRTCGRFGGACGDVGRLEPPPFCFVIAASV